MLRTPRIDTGASGTTVASYRDLRGAALAIRELAERGLDTETIHVRPADVQPVGALVDVSERPRRRRRRAVVAGAAAGIAFVLLVGLSLASVLAGAVLGVGAGWSLLGIEDARRAWARSRTRRKSNVVRATRFDIVCSEQADRAAHLLARWWDPSASPAAPSHQAA